MGAFNRVVLYVCVGLLAVASILQGSRLESVIEQVDYLYSELQVYKDSAECEVTESTEDAITYSDYGFSSDYELDYVERVVMHETENQPFEGQVAVAQCIYNTSVMKGKSALDVVQKPGQYASPYVGEVSESVKRAVKAVFVDGYTITEEPIMYFYAPAYGVSHWHENNLTYVITVADHRFFKE